MSNNHLSRIIPLFRVKFAREMPCVVRNSVLCRLHTSPANMQQAKKLEGDNPYPFMSSIENQSFQTTESFKKPGNEDAWEYQSIVMSLSLATFLLYFCVLRKENHIDKHLEKSIYLAVPNLEVQDLKAKIKHEKREGKDTKELEEKLAALEARK